MPRSQRASAMVEFALIAPVLTMIIFATAEFGIYVLNLTRLTHAVTVGARQLSISRPSSTPYTSTRTAIQTASLGLTWANVGVTLSVAGGICTSDTACKTALGNAIGGAATVTATYPCSIPLIGWGDKCTITSSSSEPVQ